MSDAPCERCGTASPPDQAGAYACAFGCTFCEPCNCRDLLGVCPNCGGELLPRPRRKALPASFVLGNVRQAEASDFNALLPLFVAYRAFYGVDATPTNEADARAFLRERITRRDSVILLIWGQARALGFVQLYPIFSAVRAQRSYLLNDLFVTSEARGMGHGEALLHAARTYASAQRAASLMLQTARSNLGAQRLYQRTGWQRDREFCTYTAAAQAPHG
jgi:ribosomal protein S18 acetylase RimI-like enzyme